MTSSTNWLYICTASATHALLHLAVKTQCWRSRCANLATSKRHVAAVCKKTAYAAAAVEAGAPHSP
eukprot:9995981-Alexandrium_andersonii.AAC.1